MPEIIEAAIDLGAATLTSSGCSNPERAADANPATAATFGIPDALDEPWTAVVNSDPQPGLIHCAYFGVTSAARAPRFLNVAWGYDTFVARVRVKASGVGLENIGVSLLSSLGFIEQDESGDPPSIPILLPPFPDGDGFYTVDFDPSLYALGVVVHPDALLSAAELADLAPGAYPTLLLSQLDVYENVEEGNETMPNPTVQRVRVGVQEVKVYPWNGVTGPYNATTECSLYGLEGIDMTITSKDAVITGGETVHQLGAYETERDVKISVSANTTDLRILQLLLGGSFAVDPAAGQVGEVQYHAPKKNDRAPYFQIRAKSTNGDGTDSYVWVKCKVNGSISWNLNKDKEAMLKFDATCFWDNTYVRQDGDTGGLMENLFGQNGETTRHS